MGAEETKKVQDNESKPSIGQIHLVPAIQVELD